MRYFLVIILLLGCLSLSAQALPRAIFQKIQTADGSKLTPDDITIRAYIQDRPEEVHTNITRPKHFKFVELDTIHKGYYILLNLAAFPSTWEPGEVLVADVTQKSTGAFVHFSNTIPLGTNVVWLEDPVTLSHVIPNAADNPSPADQASGVPVKSKSLSWSYKHIGGYKQAIAFRIVLSEDSLFTDPTVLYVKKAKGNRFSMNLAKNHINLKPETSYYWKVIPTASTDPKIQPSSLHPLIIDGKLLSSNESGDAVDVPVWSFTTGNK